MHPVLAESYYIHTESAALSALAAPEWTVVLSAFQPLPGMFLKVFGDKLLFHVCTPCRSMLKNYYLKYVLQNKSVTNCTAVKCDRRFPTNRGCINEVLKTGSIKMFLHLQNTLKANGLPSCFYWINSKFNLSHSFALYCGSELI